jgi:hypothetical protein
MDIEGTRTTPFIHIEPGKIEIKGRSIPEDSFEFYSPVLHAVEEYFKSGDPRTEIHFHLEYINSGSKKFITNILGNCNKHFLNGRNIQIQWFYDSDDESMQELGNDLKVMIQIPFNMISVG